jgi:hypothetical protein
MLLLLLAALLLGASTLLVVQACLKSVPNSFIIPRVTVSAALCMHCCAPTAQWSGEWFQ